jgi:hypothetical protein
LGVVGVVVVVAFLYRFTGVLAGVLIGEGEGEGEESLRFWIEVDLESLEGGWANAGSDFLVERARGDCDILVSCPLGSADRCEVGE